jgi:hypothetical protein
LFRCVTKLLVFWIVVFATALSAVQQPLPQKQNTRVIRERSSEIETLIGRARSLPAEFAIDIFIRVQKSNRVDKQWRKEILEEAFTLTTSVQNELREKGIPFPNASADTRASYRSLAFSLGLDSLSLRVRIIEQMLTIDTNAALRMFNEISPKLPFKTLTCSARTEYDVTDFYRLVEKVTRTGYDLKRIEQGERVQFILPYIENLTSPAQITPIANLLISLNLRPRESFIISPAFATAIKKVNADDRSFSSALMRDRTTNNVFRLVNVYRESGVPYDQILNGYRSYLSRHLKAARCEDNLTLIEQQLKEVNYFFSDNAISIDDSTPESVEEVPVPPTYFESSQSKTLLDELKELRGFDDDDPATREPHTSAAWQEKMLDYLRRLEAWDGSGEADAEDYFHQKCFLYHTLILLAPAGPQSDQALLSYLKLLGEPKAITESRVEWLWHVNKLVQYINGKPPGERMPLLSILANSKNPILQVYGDLSKANL